MSNTINKVVSAKQVAGYALQLVFDDNTSQTVDFGPFLKQSRHPDVRSFLSPERFSSFKLEHGELVWGDYDLCFPVIDLYRNCIERVDHLAQVA